MNATTECRSLFLISRTLPQFDFALGRIGEASSYHLKKKHQSFENWQKISHDKANWSVMGDFMTILRFFLIQFLVGACSLFVFAQEAEVKVSLSPAGSFVGKTKDVKGTVETDGTTYTAKDIVVGLATLETGIELRDKHTKEHLEVDKYPSAKLIKATGKDGKGTGTIEIRGVQKEISGTYKVDGSTLTAVFSINFPDFNIKGIRYSGIGVKDAGTITVRVPVIKKTATPSPLPAVTPKTPGAAKAPATPKAPAQKGMKK